MKFLEVAKNYSNRTLGIAKKCFAILKEHSVKGYSFVKKHLAKGYSMVKSALVKFSSFVYNNVKKYAKKSPRIFAGVLASLVFAISTSTAALAAGVTVAYNVVVEKQVVATVKDKTVLAEAEILTSKVLENSKCNSLVSSAKLVYGLSTEEKMVDAHELAKRIVDNSSKISKYAVLSIDGIMVAGEQDINKLNSALDKYLEDYKKSNDAESVEYCSNLSAKEKYIPLEDANNLQNIENYITTATLPVQYFKTVVETCAIDYGVEKTNSNELLLGSTKTISAGIEGQKEVTYKVAYKDGVQTEKIELASKVIKEPVAKKVLVGTKKVSSADINSNLPMCWPLKRVERSYVSSYMGDGRGHKGMDICAPKGTPIYATYEGEVVFASQDSSGYGKYIIIDHKNGYKTLYAHCSELYVKKGDVVSQGEHIAAVGSTGYSTGNHVHFEVRKGSTYLNPAKFIGTK